MNVLSFESSTANGLSFTLLVDGQPLAELLGGMDREIPFYLLEGELPRPSDSSVLNWINHTPVYRGHEEEVRLVAVCSCGEQGCGCTLCRLVDHGETVTLRDFLGSGMAGVIEREFRFSRKNYEAVLAAMRDRARAFTTACP
jgi:hypothetical protein